MLYKGSAVKNIVRPSIFAALAMFLTVMTVTILANAVLAANYYAYDVNSCCEGCEYCDSNNIDSNRLNCDYPECDCRVHDCCRTGYCTEGYANEYRCSGTERQRLWINDDCGREWVTVDKCSTSCSNGQCGECANMNGEVRPSTPSTVYGRETIYTDVNLHNTGSFGGYFSFDVYVCESDGTGCIAMVCGSNRVYVDPAKTVSVSCSRYVSEPGQYKISDSSLTGSCSR